MIGGTSPHGQAVGSEMEGQAVNSPINRASITKLLKGILKYRIHLGLTEPLQHWTSSRKMPSGT